MAALGGISKGSVLSKAEYLKRYLGDEDVKTSKRKKIKKKRVFQTGKGMKIVDDDVDWKQLVNADMEENHEDDEEEAPVVAEVIDERPEEIKRLEEFRTSNKWKVLGVTDEESQDSQEHHGSYSTISTGDESQMQLEEMSQRTRHDSPDVSAKKRVRHDSPEFSSMRKTRHDSPDHSPVRKSHSSSRDISPQPQKADGRKGCVDSLSYSSRSTHKTHPSSLQKKCSEGSSTSGQRNDSDSDLSPPRRAGHPSQDSDLSPPRKLKQRQNSDSDLSPPRRGLHAGHNSDSDLSPPRRKSDLQTGSRMLSGGAAGLVSVGVLRKEQDENRKRSKKDYALEDESRNAATVFRDKSGKRRDLELEREEQRRKAEEKMEKDKKYAQWGKGVAQGQMQQQNVEEALKEAQKPLARHIDDVDLDRMLREQEREGDPMAGLLRKKKEKDSNRKGVREKPRYKGPPPPPNRFNIMPGYRWDGVDRSNGFEKKRYSRMADQKAVQEMAYKWSVEDM